MADYKELLRRAISALPENNGAARRAVYEKARSALVGQLRAIVPPLPARDITQHRLQLEDCIRQVEQEASEAVITLGRDGALSPRPVSAPPRLETPLVVRAAPPPSPPEPVEPRMAEAVVANEDDGEPQKSAGATSIEDIIAQAAANSGANVKLEPLAAPVALKPASFEPRPMPSIVARAEASKSGPSSALPQAPVRTAEPTIRAPQFEPRSEPLPLAASSTGSSLRTSSRPEPTMGSAALAVAPAVAPLLVSTAAPADLALSSIREVDVEPNASEAEGVIERAIETLDREARGDVASGDAPADYERAISALAAGKPSITEDPGFAAVPVEPRSGAGLTIFLVVFAILLAGAGGAGFWAWREGYVDLDQMFGQAQAPVTETADVPPAVTTPTLDTVAPSETPAPVSDTVSGPGNTATTPTTEPAAALEALEDRLEPTPEPVVPTGGEVALPDIGTGEVKGEERLGQDTGIAAANDPTASVDPAVLAGSQSLLLEASPDGQSGAVPFSGTVEWTEGADELGLPTLIGKASIPARNLNVSMTIRKNTDPSLPASHLLELDFGVSDSFIGGTIASLPGVLLKDEELVPGTPLIGASARVMANSFLFALSATAADAETNKTLLESRKWVDLAVVYGTGRNAIITLEKDADAQALFDKVFAAWQ